jgi:diguanylate cyclase (GGDEF)-like protein
LFLFGLTMLASPVSKSSHSGNYWFAAANFCGGAGLLLHGALPDAPPLLNVVLANFFLFLELSLMNKAIAEFVNRGRRVWLFLLVLSVLMSIATVRYTLWPEDHTLRVAFISVVAIAAAACSAALLFRSLRGTANISIAAMGALFSLYAATNTVRLFDVWRLPQQSFYHIWLDRTIIAGLSLGFLWMTNARLRASLEELACTDALTGTLNRRAVERQAQRVFDPRRPHKGSIAALMLDIDHFKQINDSYGHLAGDLALCAVANCLRMTMRAGDLIARLGGDEFLVILPNAGTGAAQLAASRVHAHLARLRVPYDTGEFGLKASIGVTSIDGSDLRLEDLLKLGDRALYVAKGNGRQEVCAVPEFVR